MESMETPGSRHRPTRRQGGTAWRPALALSALGVSATLGLAGLSLTTGPGTLEGVLGGGSTTTPGLTATGGSAYETHGPVDALTAQGPSVSRALVVQQAQRPEAPVAPSDPLDGIVLLSAAPRGQVLEQTVIEPAQERLEALAALLPLLEVAEPLTGVDADEVLASMADLGPVPAPEAGPVVDDGASNASPLIAQAPTTPDRTPPPTQPPGDVPAEPDPVGEDPIMRRMTEPVPEPSTGSPPTPTEPAPGTTDPTTTPGSTPTDPSTTPTGPGQSPTGPGSPTPTPGTPTTPGSIVGPLPTPTPTPTTAVPTSPAPTASPQPGPSPSRTGGVGGEDSPTATTAPAAPPAASPASAPRGTPARSAP